MSEITVSTAIEIGNKEKNKILKSLEKKFGKTTKVFFNVDPQIVSGVKIMFASKMIDLSSKKKLEIIRETLKKNL